MKNVNIKNNLILQVINSLLIRRRTTQTKSRGEVVCTTAPLYRQKGSGRARSRYLSSPIRRGGAKSHGPRSIPRSKKVNKKMRIKAIGAMINNFIKLNQFHVIKDVQMNAISTSEFIKQISKNEKYSDTHSSLLIYGRDHDNILYKSGRNVKNMKIISYKNIDAITLKKTRYIILEESAKKALGEKYEELL